jgi:hypothetical protein
MEFILYSIIGGVIGGLLWIGVLSLFKPKQSGNIQELIRQSEERQKIYELHGKQLDELLEEFKKS